MIQQISISHVQYTTQSVCSIISVKVEIGFHMLDLKLWVKDCSITFEAGERVKGGIGFKSFC